MESSISNMSSLGTKVNKDSLPHRSEFAGQHRDSRPMLKQGMECCLVSADSLSALDVDIKYAKSITKEEKEYWKKHLPRGFQFCLKGLARSVIYHQPENITEFAAHYFENNLHLRNAELSKLPEHSYFSKLCHKPTSGIQQKAFGRPERNPSSSQATHTIAQEKHSIDPQSINLQHDSHSLTVKPFLSSLVGLEETHVIGIADDEAMDSAVEEKETQLPTSSQKQDMSALKQNSASSQMHTLVKKEDTIRICRKRFEPNVSELGSEKVQFPTLSENCIFKEERTLETSAQETLRHHWTSSFPSHELSDVRETSDIYISRSHTVCGALHETKYYQNGLTLQGKNSDTGSQQVVNSNISNKNAEGINDQADSCL
ncbi:papilin [Biomphalaria glabrata]|nr:papilin [Biomphalaria glabrata]